MYFYENTHVCNGKNVRHRRIHEIKEENTVDVHNALLINVEAEIYQA